MWEDMSTKPYTPYRYEAFAYGSAGESARAPASLHGKKSARILRALLRIERASVSRVLSWTTIFLGRASPRGSSRLSGPGGPPHRPSWRCFG